MRAGIKSGMGNDEGMHRWEEWWRGNRERRKQACERVGEKGDKWIGEKGKSIS